MRPGGRPRRTTALVGLALALLLAVAYAVVSTVGPPTGPDPGPTLSPTAGPSAGPSADPADPSYPGVPSSTPPPGTPQRGQDYPVRSLGALAGRSVVTSGHGDADLRYARSPHDATRVHLTCRGCDADTWLVEQPRGFPIGAYGPLPHPEDVTAVADVADPRSTTHLLVEAARGSSWTVTLTPFAELPVHEETFDALDDDVVAVRARGPVSVTCGAASRYRSLAKEAGDTEFHALLLGARDDPGTTVFDPGRGTDLLVLDVSCAGRWTVTVP